MALTRRTLFAAGSVAGLAAALPRTASAASAPDEVLLPFQTTSLHDVPSAPADYAKVLSGIVAHALANQSANGSLELPDPDDQSDTSLGITSLLAFSFSLDPKGNQQIKDPVRRSIDYFLTSRVYYTDDPGTVFYKIRNSGLPYARYVVSDGTHTFGNWPSTVWAILQCVNTLTFSDGLLTAQHEADLLKLGQGYWDWLTKACEFNPQGTSNQALGCITAGLILSNEYRRRGNFVAAKTLRSEALRWYTDVLRPARLEDRGYLLPAEHGTAWDGNYGPISLGFLAKSYEASGEKMFLDDGKELATYIDMRLSVRGSDLGGGRYSEQHLGFEGTYGLRYFSDVVKADIGRYLGDMRRPYISDAIDAGDGTSAPNGHFAFMTIWQMKDRTPWYHKQSTTTYPYQLRKGTVSLTLDSTFQPYLIDVAGSTTIQAIFNRQHGIGPIVRSKSAGTRLLTVPLCPPRQTTAHSSTHSGLLVNTPVLSPDGALLQSQSAYVTDGSALDIITVLDGKKLPSDSVFSYLAGLPYATTVNAKKKVKILALADGSTTIGLGTAGLTHTTTTPLLAGTVAISGAPELTLTNPSYPAGDGPAYFNSPDTIGLYQQQAVFVLADLPHGYGAPEQGWQRMVGTNLVESTTVISPANSTFKVLVTRFAPPSAAAASFTVAATSDGIKVTTPTYTALVGDPSGDAHGDPVLRI